MRPARVAVHVARLERAADMRAEARRFLRHLIARRLACRPADVPIVRGANGKPRLEGGGIEFSVSCRDRWCAAALSADCPVGVDLEPIRAFAGMSEVAAQFFPQQARAAFAAAAPAERAAVFFHWWTRIEAAGKAVGCGLDLAAACLGRVSHRSRETASGLAIAVAAASRAPLLVRWHAPVAQNERVIQAIQAGPASWRTRLPEASAAL